MLAHYMPWFVAKPVNQAWGFHWTMNQFNPDEFEPNAVGKGTQSVRQRSIASEYYPSIGPYDSSDVDVIEYHLLLMKVAGIDGVIVDWYGIQPCYDYPILHRNTTTLIDQANKMGMKFAICYEDQTLGPLIEQGLVKESERVEHVASEIAWLNKNWFSLDNYVRLGGKPAMLSFGNAGLSNEQWTECIGRLTFPIAYFSEHHRRDGATGAFDWPIPGPGMDAVDRFYRDSPEWEAAIPVVFPRFVDFYGEAKVRESYPDIEDADGETFRVTLARALASKAAFAQIATWNDWGEGTVIEPSVEFGDRDLKHLQTQLLGQQADPTALALPGKLLEFRKSNGATKDELDRVADWIGTGEYAKAKSWLRQR
ncbi:glycoside hydrolase family 71/99-like protein [Rubripirellula reticaptiva]|nr:glycoside hydrolase family 71/99-like protein [Rubripirellula reticaptiva]